MNNKLSYLSLNVKNILFNKLDSNNKTPQYDDIISFDSYRLNLDTLDLIVKDLKQLIDTDLSLVNHYYNTSLTIRHVAQNIFKKLTDDIDVKTLEIIPFKGWSNSKITLLDDLDLIDKIGETILDYIKLSKTTNIIINNNKIYLVSSLLVSVIERLLGNIIRLQYSLELKKRDVENEEVKTPPLQQPSEGRMLRDILDDKLLESAIGSTLVWCLKVIIGPPIGINFRNILWHGFISSNELDISLVLFLFLIFFNIVDQLEMKVKSNIENPIEADLIISSSKKHLLNLNSKFKDHQSATTTTDSATDTNNSNFKLFYDISMAGEKSFRDLLNDSTFIVRGRESLWEDAFHYYKLQQQQQLQQTKEFRYNRYFSLVFLLPQLEHSLRCLFVECNKLSENFLCADYLSYYTTLDLFLSDRLTLNESSTEQQLQIAITKYDDDDNQTKAYYKYQDPKYRKLKDTIVVDPESTSPSPLSSTSSPIVSTPPIEEVNSKLTEFENEIYHLLDKDIVQSLLDLLLYPDGPRVRDRISHGEIDHLEIPDYFIDQLFNISILILFKTSPLFKEKYYKSSMSSQFPILPKPLFHSKQLTHHKLNQLIISNQSLSNYLYKLNSKKEKIQQLKEVEDNNDSNSIDDKDELLYEYLSQPLETGYFEIELNNIDLEINVMLPTQQDQNYYNSIKRLSLNLTKLITIFHDSGKSLKRQVIKENCTSKRIQNSFYKWYGLSNKFSNFSQYYQSLIIDKFNQYHITLSNQKKLIKENDKLNQYFDKILMKMKNNEWELINNLLK